MMRKELTSSHKAGAAPFPWQRPWRIRWMSPPIKEFDSPHPIRRKNFMSWIERSIAIIAPEYTPTAMNMSTKTAWWTWS